MTATTTFLWLHLTDKCQLECTHCATDSGPDRTHGAMTDQDWLTVIDTATAMGVSRVQFVGGEPTLHPALCALIDHALWCGLKVEVFSNLVHVTPEQWRAFTREGVSLATSYYSNDAQEHAAITRRPSYARTRANISKAQSLNIPLRAGVIDFGGGQRAKEAQTELVNLGVPSIGYDKVRGLGRAAPGQQRLPSELCGRCGSGNAAIDPNGDVHPCLFGNWVTLGNVRERSLAEILAGMPAVRANLVSLGMPELTDGPCRPEETGDNCYPHNEGFVLVGSGPCRPESTGDNCYPHNCHPR